VSDHNEYAVVLKDVAKSYFISESTADTLRGRVFNIFKSKSKREIKALLPLNLKIKKGEKFGIVGRNGSGKSTLLQVLMSTIQPNKGGIVETNGRLVKLSLALGFDPLLSGRENVYINGSVLGLTINQINSKINEIIAFSELQKFIDTKVKFYSSGMRARLAFAVAIHAEADIFLFDEFFGGVGDIRFKRRSSEAFKQAFMKDKTVIIVSHGLDVIRKNCKRTLVLDRGKFIGIGPTEEMLEKYQKLVLPKKNLKPRKSKKQP